MLTTRSISWRTLVSRSGVPRWPRKYLLTTTLVASWLQNVGDLDVLLLEDGLAGLVGDAGRPVLPGDLVVGVDARAGPAALEGQAAGPLAGEAGTVRAAETLAGGGTLAPGLGRRRLGRAFASITGTTSRAWAIPVQISSAPTGRGTSPCMPPARMGVPAGVALPGARRVVGVRQAPSGWCSRRHDGGDRSCGTVRRVGLAPGSPDRRPAVPGTASPWCSGVVRWRGDLQTVRRRRAGSSPKTQDVVVQWSIASQHVVILCGFAPVNPTLGAVSVHARRRVRPQARER